MISTRRVWEYFNRQFNQRTRDIGYPSTNPLVAETRSRGSRFVNVTGYHVEYHDVFGDHQIQGHQKLTCYVRVTQKLNMDSASR